jgi:hypothetical protein
MKRLLAEAIEKVNQFAKLAGVIEVPPKMLSEGIAWAKSVYCQKVLKALFVGPLHENEGKQWRGHTIAECRKHIKERFSNPYSIKIDLKGSRYDSPPSEGIDHPMDENVVCRFIFSEDVKSKITSNSNWKGLWNGMIYLFKNEDDLAIDLYSLRQELTDIEITIRHEMQHMMQEHLALLQAIPDGYGGIERLPQAGLPGKKYRTPGFDEYGRPMERGQPLEHEQRDIEFYTNLTDNLDQYKRIINSVPLPVRQAFFKAWVGQMPIEEFGKLIDSISVSSGRHPKAWIIDFASVRAALQTSQAFFGRFNAMPKYDKAIKVLYSELSKVVLV